MAHLAAWGVLLALAGLSIAVARRLGPVGLILIGLLTLFVCSQIALDDATPTWGVDVFKARLTKPRTVEDRAAAAASTRDALSPLRFYRWCGALLTAAGLAGLGWQLWR